MRRGALAGKPRRNRRLTYALIGTTAAAAVLAAPGTVQAEPADADPTFFTSETASGPAPVALTQFTLAGADIALIARGRSASIDTTADAAALEEGRELAKAFSSDSFAPYVTFDFRIYF